MEKLYDWFCENREDIIKGHRGEQVLIKDNAVIGYFPDEPSALKSAFEKGFHIGEFIVQDCYTEDEDTMFYFNQAVSFE